MQIEILTYEGHRAALVRPDEGEAPLIATPQMGLELLMNVMYVHSVRALILEKEQLREGFFDLRTGLLGELLQKFVNYHARLALVGDFSAVRSRALKDFIYESNRGRHAFFAPDIDTALQHLARTDPPA